MAIKKMIYKHKYAFGKKRLRDFVKGTAVASEISGTLTPQMSVNFLLDLQSYSPSLQFWRVYPCEGKSQDLNALTRELKQATYTEVKAGLTAGVNANIGNNVVIEPQYYYDTISADEQMHNRNRLPEWSSEVNEDLNRQKLKRMEKEFYLGLGTEEAHSANKGIITFAKEEKATLGALPDDTNLKLVLNFDTQGLAITDAFDLCIKMIRPDYEDQDGGIIIVSPDMYSLYEQYLKTKTTALGDSVIINGLRTRDYLGWTIARIQALKTAALPEPGIVFYTQWRNMIMVPNTGLGSKREMKKYDRTDDLDVTFTDYVAPRLATNTSVVLGWKQT